MAAAPAQAAEWWLVANSNGNDLIFIDTESLVISGNDRSFWVHTHWNKPKYNVAADLSYHKIECEKRTYTLEKLIKFDSSKSIVSDYNYRPPVEELIVPGGLMHSIRNFVCSPSEKHKDKAAGPFDMDPFILGGEIIKSLAESDE